MNRRQAISSLAAGAGALAVGSTQAATSPGIPSGGPPVPALHAPGVNLGGFVFVKLAGSAGSVYVNPADIAAMSGGFATFGGAVTNINLVGGGTVQVSGSPDSVVATIAAQLAP